MNDVQARALVGDPESVIWQAWQCGEPNVLSDDVLERLSHVVGIYSALHALVGDEGSMRAWLRAPNLAAVFEGRPALKHMLSSHPDSLRDVRNYLNGQLYGGW